ncbi:MAG: hypothetical protein H7Y43_13595 [Akkermansiaceae bacterium]|nr:hypothetical protein [Verrucomicrobiales bacterium]
MPTDNPIASGADYQAQVQHLSRPRIASGILTVDFQGTISALSDDVERLLNLSSLPRPLKLEDLPAPLQLLIREVEKTGHEAVNRQIVVSRGEANPVPMVVNVTRSILNAPASVIVAISAGSLDASVEQNLQRLDRLASVGTVSASMAHEIKNALVAVRTFIELLLEKNPDADLAGIVRREISRVDSIAGQMLRFSAPAQPMFSSVHLHKLLEHSLRLVQHGNANKRITFQSDFKAEQDVLSGDDHQLEQAFVNLLFNAIESMPEEGALTVGTDLIPDDRQDQLREGDLPKLVRIKISDTGAGIEPDKLARIFEPFFTTKQNGTGLGLAVTHRIVTEHQGSIHVESAVGQGTTFIILLPAGSRAYHP